MPIIHNHVNFVIFNKIYKSWAILKKGEKKIALTVAQLYRASTAIYVARKMLNQKKQYGTWYLIFSGILLILMVISSVHLNV